MIKTGAGSGGEDHGLEICNGFFNQSLVIVCHGTIREEESNVVAFVMLPSDVGCEGSVAETKTNERKNN